MHPPKTKHIRFAAWAGALCLGLSTLTFAESIAEAVTATEWESWCQDHLGTTQDVSECAVRESIGEQWVYALIAEHGTPPADCRAKLDTEGFSAMAVCHQAAMARG